jgi:tetratricopeptide (TPR) repeat protein
LEFHPEDARALYLGALALIPVGQRDRALEWTQRALAVDPEDPAVLYNIACVYARLNMADPAIGCLEKALQQGEWYKAWAEHDSDLDSIRGYPRFQTLLKSI